MEKNQILVILALGLSLISLILGGVYTMKISGGEWTCITQKCQEFITGEAWVAQNCKPTGPDNQMICKFMIEDNVFSVPLSGISNLSAMESCAKYTCDSEVYIRRSG